MTSSILLALAVACLLIQNALRKNRPGPEAFELVRRMSREDQIHFQQLVTARGKINAIREFRTRFTSSLMVAKDAVELLAFVAPATLQFG